MGHTLSEIAQRFELDAKIGAGGMGEVYRARDLRDGAVVALKLLYPGADVARFTREAETMRALSHPSIVRCLDAGTTERGEHYLALEWLDGEDLGQRLAREGTAPLEVALEIAAQAADALAAAHGAGVIHRDLKPANLFLCAGAPLRLKLLDFGVARFQAAGNTFTQAGTAIGTPAYMSPEQARGDRVEASSDLFALGCVLFATLTGAPPFDAPSAIAALGKLIFMDAPRLRELDPSMPAALDELVAQLLVKDASDRTSDAAAIRDRLRELAATPPPSPSSEPPAPARPLSHDEQRLVTVVAAGLLESTLVNSSTVGPHAEAQARVREVMSRYTAEFEVLGDDGLLAVFTGDAHVADQLERAVQCALALEAWIARPVVVATGRATFANERPTGEAIDGAVSLLASLPSERSGGVWLDGITSSMLGARHQVLDEDGAQRLVRTDPRATRRLLGREAPFVGRRRELAFLSALLDEVIEDASARAVVVRADAGGGKTRLLSALREWAQEAHPDLVSWTAFGEPWSAGSPYELASQLVLDALGVERDADANARADSLVRACAGIEEPWVEPMLSELCGLSDAEGAPVHPYVAASRQDEGVRFDHLRESFARLVGRAVEEAPLLLVVEDLHWGDRDSLGLVEAALRRARDRPLLVLALSRPELPAALSTPFAALGAESITLAPLAPRAASRLVREVIAGADEALVDRLVEQAMGNAFFLEELVRAVAEGRDVGSDPSVLALVQRRIDKLTDAQRRLLRAASVFGLRFELAALRPMLGPDAAIEELVRALEAREIFLVEGDEARFAHAFVRDAAYASLTDEDRRAAHRAALAWLRERAEPGVLAEHAERAAASDAEHLEAARLFVMAGAHVLDTGRAGASIERALAALDRATPSPARDRIAIDAYIARDGMAWLAGDNRDASPRVEATVAFAERAGTLDQRIGALRHLALTRASLGDSDGGWEALHRARAIEAGSDAAELRSRLATVEVLLHFNVGAPSEARDAALRAVELARASGLVREIAAAAHNAAEVLVRGGDVDRAWELHLEAVELVTRHGLARFTIGNDILQGYVEVAHRGEPGGRALIEAALSRSVDKGQGWAAIMARFFLALLDAQAEPGSATAQALRALEREARDAGQHGIEQDAAFAAACVERGERAILRP